MWLSQNHSQGQGLLIGVPHKLSAPACTKPYEEKATLISFDLDLSKGASQLGEEMLCNFKATK